MDQEASRRVAELRGEILRLEDLYYRVGNPEATDREFDAMMGELIELEVQHPDLLTPDSPSQRVGGEPVESFEQVEHNPVMLSLDNTYSTDDLREWVERLRRLEPEADFVFVAELKIDGVSISLVYEDRLLVRAATRGIALRLSLAGATRMTSVWVIGSMAATRTLRPTRRISNRTSGR